MGSPMMVLWVSGCVGLLVPGNSNRFVNGGGGLWVGGCGRALFDVICL